MLQTATITMAATLKASTEGLDIIDKARRKKGWTKTEKAWAGLANTSQATLRRFWGGVAIQSEAFKDICEAVGVAYWENIVEEKAPDSFEASMGSKRLSFAIAGSIEEIDKHKLDAIVALLNKLGGDTSIEILDIEEGSIKLTLGGSVEALARIEALAKIEALFNSGELGDIEGVSVQDVHVLAPEELAQSIRESGGEALNLSGAYLFGTNLSDTNLNNANLFGVYLSDANLSGADLHDANLSGADLRDTNLFDANLRRTNLRDASLRGVNLGNANLSDADLSGANLRNADLSGANLRNADLSRADLNGGDLSGAIVTETLFDVGNGLSDAEKQSLIERGAIFTEAPGDNVFSPILVPAPRR